MAILISSYLTNEMDQFHDHVARLKESGWDRKVYCQIETLKSLTVLILSTKTCLIT